VRTGSAANSAASPAAVQRSHYTRGAPVVRRSTASAPVKQIEHAAPKTSTVRSWALFGTNGVRGVANSEPITPETMLRLAMALGECFRDGRRRQLAVIGKDTRLSGYMLEPALTAGFITMGLDVVVVGPLPTPAVAMLTRSLRADLGVVISASHNRSSDNGVKLFGPDGYKLSDELEARIEAVFARGPTRRAAPEELGRAKRLDDAGGRYIEFVKESFPKGLRLDGLRVVVDCGNGAAYRIAPTIFWELGAEVFTVGTSPDGFNINRECGALAPQQMRQEVLARRADIGIALDGDADRLTVSDERGALLDGDQLMALIATRLVRRNQLAGNALVATVMSNLGLERHLAARSIVLHRAAVGDRHVVETMRRHGCNLGGEPSGHIVLGDHATPGDGLIAALQVLAAIVEEGKRASEVCRVFEPLPQLQRNVRFAGGKPLQKRRVRQALAAAEAELGSKGRLVVRNSGTEPLIRLMVQGEDHRLLARVIDDICAAILSGVRGGVAAAPQANRGGAAVDGE
jgi:phosphoglucosamine mutase